MFNTLNREHFLKYFLYILMGGLFIFMFKTTGFKYGSLYVDTFRDPWIVEEIFHGKVVYRDLFYEYGFLPPYVLAGLCALFSYHLNVFIFCGAALTIGCAVFIYRTLRLFIARFAATLAVCIFFIVFAFGRYYYQAIFNSILPYNFASIFFVLFSLAALFYFLRFVLKERLCYAYLWVIAMVLAFLSRPIMGSFIYLGFLMPWGIIWAKGLFYGRRRILFLALFPVIIAAAVYAIFLSVTQAWAGFNESIVRQAAVRSFGMDTGYAARTMGLNHPWFNLLVAIVVFAVVMVCVTLLAFAAAFFSKRNLFAFGLLFFAAAFAVGIFFLMNIDQYRYLPILAAVLAFWYAYRVVIGGATRDIAFCAVFSLGFFLALRVAFHANPADCGFCFLTAALIGHYLFFFRILNDFLCRKVKNFSPRLFNIFIAVFFIFINSFYPIVSWALLRNRTMPVMGPRGGIIAENDRATHIFQETADYLRGHTDKDATVTGVPEISGINFFAERRNPLRYYAPTYTFLALCGEEKMVGEFAAKKPDYIAMLSSKECDRIGVDYGFELNSWINDHYRVEKIFGDYPYRGKWSGGIAIFKRKGG